MISMNYLILCHIVFLYTLVIPNIGHNGKIDEDYYFGIIRTGGGRPRKCADRFYKLFCEYKCQELGFKCLDDKCVCLGTAVRSTVSEVEMKVASKKSVRTYQPRENEFLEPDLLLPANTLRHHIAHFCPNLELARKCIHKCMSLGKPAFCGKDHVCYCSHKSKYNDDYPINATDVYTQFKDMYIKYFGPGIFQEKPEKPVKEVSHKKKKEVTAEDEDGGEDDEGGDHEEEEEEEEEKGAEEETEPEAEDAEKGEEEEGKGEEAKEEGEAVTEEAAATEAAAEEA